MSLSNYMENPFAENPLLRSDAFQPRRYQVAMAQKACARNTLLVLPTALGKTIIAVLCAAHFLANGRGRVLCLAPTRPLVLQHAETFRKHMRLGDEEVVALTGRLGAGERDEVWGSKARVLLATPEVVKNDVEGKRISLDQFSLLIFDECHRARRDYAYTYVAKKYAESDQSGRILGMTASPGGDREKIAEICKALFIQQIDFRTEEDPDVAPYFRPIDLDWKFIDVPKEYREISAIIREMLRDRLDWLHKYGFLKKNPAYVNRSDLLRLSEELRAALRRGHRDKGPIYSAIVAQSVSITLFHSIELIETQGLSALDQFLKKIDAEAESKKSYGNVVADGRYEAIRGLVELHSQVEHPKVSALIEIVKKQVEEHPESRVLIFSQYRETATHLIEALREKVGFSVARFVGQASRMGDEGLTQDEQMGILREFREGRLKALVATSVAEEGLDVPSVDLVVFYEPVPSEIRFIQRKGRTGRSRVGKAFILAAKDSLDMAYLFVSKKRAERMRALIKSLNRELQAN